jgi:hypothetical protein
LGYAPAQAALAGSFLSFIRSVLAAASFPSLASSSPAWGSFLMKELMLLGAALFTAAEALLAATASRSS